MVAKFCSRSHGQPLPGVRSAAMISSRREISREGVMALPRSERGSGLMPQRRARPSETSRAGGCFPPIGPAVDECYGHAMSDQLQTETALVLFSGGQDSATCLAWALQRFARVEMLGFDYGQRHAIELRMPGPPARRHEITARGLGRKARREPYAGNSDSGRYLRHRADARCRDRDGRRRPAQHLRARPQPGVPDLRRRAGLPARHHAISSAACARPIIPAIRIAATRPSRRCRPRSISAWPDRSNCIRR